MKKGMKILAAMLAAVLLGGCADTPATKPNGNESIPVKTENEKADSVILDLTEYFNKDAFSWCKTPWDGNFDELYIEGVASYCADDLPQEVFTYEGAQYKLGSLADGEKNCVKCEGQIITLPEPMQCNYIGLLGAANCGDYDGEFLLHYEDGSSDVFYPYMTDWCDDGADEIVLRISHRHQDLANQQTFENWEETNENGRDVYPCYISLYRLTAKADKKVVSIEFADEAKMNVFAATVVTEGEKEK